MKYILPFLILLAGCSGANLKLTDGFMITLVEFSYHKHQMKEVTNEKIANDPIDLDSDNPFLNGEAIK